MKDFKDDDGTVINEVKELVFLKEEKEAMINRANSLDKSSSQYQFDSITYLKEARRLDALIEKTELNLIHHLGEGKHKFQMKDKNKTNLNRTEIEINGGVVNLKLYSAII